MSFRKNYLVRRLTGMLMIVNLWFVSAAQNTQPSLTAPAFRIVKNTLRKEILKQASWALNQSPITVTSSYCERSAGGLHDFFSEGDYWWPNPADPNGPYIQKDGMSNPENFTAHRKAMIRFSQLVGALTSAYLITGDEKYAKHVAVHLSAWFMDEKTRMNPSLLYAQAIKGKVTGRSIGIIDMIQMMEVAQSVRVLEQKGALDREVLKQTKAWFSDYLNWVTTHPYGVEEREAKNNHGTCWVMQVAVFAKLVSHEALIKQCQQRYQSILLPNQMDLDGSFPLEMKRTKPYGYSLFNLDAMATICQVLSDAQTNLWNYTTEDGKNIGKGIAFMYPYVLNKTSWPYPPDVMYWNEWPVAHPFLVFGAANMKQKQWWRLWKKGEHAPQNEEVIRNLPVRNPLIWVVDGEKG